MSMRDRIAQALASIKAFHGSPHDFDRFDLSKVGTGEGAQAFGHGLYFADREGVAKSYRDRLQKTTSPHFTYDGERVNPTLMKKLEGSAEPEEKWFAERYRPLLMSRSKDAPLDDVYADLAYATSTRDKWLARKAEYEANPPVASTYGPEHFDQFAAAAQNRINSLSAVLPRLGWEKGGPTGKMYEVNINAAPEQLLNWDKPMGEQSNKVIDAMRPAVTERLDASQAARNAALQRGTDAFGKPLSEERIANLSTPVPPFEGLTGQRGYEMMGLPANNQWSGYRQSSARLNEAGVPGLTYLDRMSRGAGEGSSNYVMFDDRLIDIMRKYGLAGAAPVGAATGMGLLAAQDQYEAAQ